MQPTGDIPDPKRVLVTGGSGYLGTGLMEHLAARESVEEIINVDIRPPSRDIEKATFIERSVTEDLRDLFERGGGVDLAIHLAWTVDPLRDSRRQREICIGGTGRFLEGCHAGGVRHVFFVSSATAYGAHPDNDHPLEETDPLGASHHFQYSGEKREAEGLFREYLKDHQEILLQIVRPCIVFGPNVSNFIFRTVERPVTLRALGKNPPIQLVHEDDCSAAMAAVIKSRLPGAFNIAAADTMPIGEAYKNANVRAIPVPLKLMRGIASLAWRMNWTWLTEAPPDFVYFVSYPWILSTRRLTQEVKFTPRYTTRETMQAYLASRKGDDT
jgi:UDP-glucose 4-epimerase